MLTQRSIALPGSWKLFNMHQIHASAAGQTGTVIA
jgi:hypothetical protein